jgi:deazaflavin-dependent oxidoreductase (nitroreductase family)
MPEDPEDLMTDLAGFNEKLITEFRANGGKVTGMFAKSPLVLLTTTGAKSGKERTTPVVQFEDGGNLVIVASLAGAPKNPAWFLNIQANPEVTIERGTEKFRAAANIAARAERDRLYARASELMPAFAEYQQKTTRVIPVVVLERLGNQPA